MIRSRKKPHEKKEGGAPGWVVTFGDMMSLLLCFFIAIVSFSSIEIERYRAAMGSFRGALQSPFSTSNKPSGPPLPALSEKMFEAQEAVETAAEIKNLVKSLESSDGIETEILPEGVKVTVSNPVLFDEGSADLKSSALDFLSKLARIIIRHDPIEVFIEGHTDDTPIHTARFPSNWELSAARALKVLELFQGSGVPPKKMVAIGYGEYRPKKQLPRDATGAAKGLNRRVEIMLQLRNRVDKDNGIPGSVLSKGEENRIGEE